MRVGIPSRREGWDPIIGINWFNYTTFFEPVPNQYLDFRHHVLWSTLLLCSVSKVERRLLVLLILVKLLTIIVYTLYRFIFLAESIQNYIISNTVYYLGQFQCDEEAVVVVVVW